jgi:hypothetical protein
MLQVLGSPFGQAFPWWAHDVVTPSFSLTQLEAFVTFLSITHQACRPVALFENPVALFENPVALFENRGPSLAESGIARIR